MKRWILTLAFLIGAVMLHAQTTPIVRLNCTAANYPLCGASGHEFNSGSSGAHNAYGRAWDATFMPGAGPNGENVVEFHLIPIPNATTDDEFYMGWVWGLSGQSAVAQGASRYIRYKMMIMPGTWVGPNGGRVGGKQIILGADGTPDQWRLLHNMRSNLDANDVGDPTHAMTRTERNISAGRIDLRTLPFSQWLNIQLVAKTSSTASATDASLKIYMNNGNQAAPDQQSTGYNWIPTGWSGTSDSRFAFGAYWQAAGSGSNVRFRIAAIELDDQWDPNWHTNGVVPPVPFPPSIIRVTP